MLRESLHILLLFLTRLYSLTIHGIPKSILWMLQAISSDTVLKRQYIVWMQPSPVVGNCLHGLWRVLRCGLVCPHVQGLSVLGGKRIL